MTSQTLLDVAIDQFGRLGFEGASTREIARASGTAMSSITYHFGGKEGLYLAAADHIAAQIREIQGPAAAAALEAGAASAEAAREAAAGLLDSLGQMMLHQKTEGWSRFIIREQQYPTEAFNRLFEGAMRMVFDAAAELIARARPDLDPRQVTATAILFFGQVIVLRAGHAAICRVLGTDHIDEANAALLLASLRASAFRILSETPE
ncbi:CerR family C-terminal domain-containing protein [Sphingomonas sp. dw_22]|uniref:CerR family C-terminal domain-containing protein n=1 Tax=Sphingomonas sp. dw_22 TaxID=2721175 RepID=UPI001BD26618|nr:CerR family C-terminal domain-containing protein [Sphingomonas sp. dw_22]